MQPLGLLKQEPLIPIILEEFFLSDLFGKVTVNIILYFEHEDEDDKDDV